MRQDPEHVNNSFVIQNEKAFALVGSPNSGKTTLYNWLTGSNYKTVNYPGSTVEFSVGSLQQEAWGKNTIQVIDTPGVYSLQPKSEDERVAIRAIYDNPLVESVRGIIVVIDGTQLSRHLMIAEQIRETGFPMIIALTMSDILRRKNIKLNLSVLENRYNCPVVLIDGLLGGGIKDLVQYLDKTSEILSVKKPPQWTFSEQSERMKLVADLSQKVLSDNEKLSEKFQEVMKLTKKIDQYLLHPIFGILSFIFVMTVLFTSIFWLAAPFMDLIDSMFSAINAHLDKLLTAGLFKDFLTRGMLSSFSAVLVFVPQIFILFFGVAILESTGYLARAATLVDKPFSKLGMSGRSFVPILSGFACAVPAMMATRNISSARDRWITNFIIPLMTCSARLPVFALLLAFVFAGQEAWKPGIILALIYFASAFIGALAASVLNRFLPKQQNSLLVMELPLYRRPRLRVLIQQATIRTKAYVKRAGPAIFIFSLLIWAGTSFPNYQMEMNEHDRLEQSYLGQVGKVLEPLVQPMGVDWRVGVGLLSAFAAREVFVSSMALIFNIDSEEDSQQEGLLTAMRDAKNSQGRLIFTPASITALIIFFMIALQCLSTVAVSMKETNSVKFALGQLFVFNTAAYLIAVLAHTIISKF